MKNTLVMFFEKHEDQPSIRMQAKIIQKEINGNTARGIVSYFFYRQEIKPEHLVQVLTHLHCR
jgi:hypothetical protein